MSCALLDCQRSFGDNPCCEIEVQRWNINPLPSTLLRVKKNETGLDCLVDITLLEQSEHQDGNNACRGVKAVEGAALSYNVALCCIYAIHLFKYSSNLGNTLTGSLAER